MIKIRINFDILVVARLFYEKQKQQKRIGKKKRRQKSDDKRTLWVARMDWMMAARALLFSLSLLCHTHTRKLIIDSYE